MAVFALVTASIWRADISMSSSPSPMPSKSVSNFSVSFIKLFLALTWSGEYAEIFALSKLTSKSDLLIATIQCLSWKSFIMLRIFWSSSSNIIYTGLVQDLTAYINLGDVCISPYPPSARIGTGCPKNKIIEYFACGKPVITTEEGITGFGDAVPDRDFLLAKDSDDFIEKLVTVLYDENLSKMLGKNARKLSLKYDWGNLSKEVLKVLESVAANKEG